MSSSAANVVIALGLVAIGLGIGAAGIYVGDTEDAPGGVAEAPAAMTTALTTLQVTSRRQWRSWLAAHHASSPGVWIVRHKLHTGVTSMTYEDLVCEALCFGWVDSLVKRLDDDRYATKVTPRKPTSKWSESNRRRWSDLEAAGLLTAAGRAAAPTNTTYASRPVIPTLPAYIATALKANPKAWAFFRELAPTYRRNFVVWIHTAKRADTRARRLQESVALLAAGRKLGLK
ncbi:YdeI/OmpD-associated family protein [Luteitalea pratensis]|nr:YdeI/OmpD-associated family protein [Luteitalea pratensis]